MNQVVFRIRAETWAQRNFDSDMSIVTDLAMVDPSTALNLTLADPGPAAAL